jgi:HEAT repeat protein
MKTICSLLTVAVLAVGCKNDASPPEQETIDPQVPNLFRLSHYQTFGDTSAAWPRRLEAGIAISRFPGGPEYLNSMYFSGQAVLVRSVLDSLEVSDTHNAARLAASLLKDSPGEEIVVFEVILLRLGNAAVKPLVDLLSSNAHWQARLQALDALGKLESKDAFEAIATCLRDSNIWVRIGAAHALGNLDDPRVVEHLTDVLKDTSDVVVAASLVALGKLGDHHALSSIHPLLANGNARIRSAAVSALGRLGQAESIPHLEQLLGDPDEGVRFKTSRAIRVIKKATAGTGIRTK